MKTSKLMNTLKMNEESKKREPKYYHGRIDKCTRIGPRSWIFFYRRINITKVCQANSLPMSNHGDKNVGVLTRIKERESTCFLSKLEPKTIKDILKDEYCIKSMKDEMEKKYLRIKRPRH